MKTLEQVETKITHILDHFERRKDQVKPKRRKELMVELQQLRAAKLCLEHYQSEEQLLRLQEMVYERVRQIGRDFEASHDVDHLPEETVEELTDQFYEKRGIEQYRNQLLFINFILLDYPENQYGLCQNTFSIPKSKIDEHQFRYSNASA